uniref:C2H2-type domain-containing protein n=1 Tax=Plectus sambesii TaxID=2011161 RepID=A0A914UX93_9BILA
MPPKRTTSETCQVCKKRLKIVYGNEMRLHLLSDHEQKVADVLYSEKVEASPELQWIKEYISTATEMMQLAQNHHNANSTRKRPAPRDREREDESFATPPVASGLRRSIRTSRSGSRELSTPPVAKTALPKRISRESSIERTPVSTGDKKGATCRECGVDGIKHGLELRHILQSHLDIPAFTCSRCDYVNTYNRDSAMKHAQRMHSAKATGSVIVDNTAEHEAVIGDLMDKCFPNDTPTSTPPIAAAINRRSSPQSPASDALPKSSSRKACGLCGKQIASDEFLQHAWNEHRRASRRIYRCSMCSYATVENRHRVQTHISKEHDDDPRATIVRDDDAEFRKLVEHCFGKDVSEAPGIKAPTAVGGSVINAVEADYKPNVSLFESSIDCRLCDTILPLTPTAMRQHLFRFHADRP